MKFDFGKYEISEKDLIKIEKKIIELSREKNIFIRKEINKKEAIDFFKAKNDPYKLELLNDLEDGTITFYKQGKFTDLCRGPHLPNTGYIKLKIVPFWEFPIKSHGNPPKKRDLIYSATKNITASKLIL